MKRTALLTTLCILAILMHASCYAADNISVYPLPGIFLSPKVSDDQLLKNAISSDGTGTDRNYARDLFVSIFKEKFNNVASDITDKNKYSTLVAYIYISRVSQYSIEKSDQLVDFYLPMTMSIYFVNMMTGESVYSYSYTYYTKYDTTKASLTNPTTKNEVVARLYRETLGDLLKKVVDEAKQNFNPFAVNVSVKKEWNGLYVLDKGNRDGIAKDDLVMDQFSNQLSIIYASMNYSVGQSLLGEPKSGSIYTKLSNQSLDEIKKPKIMLFTTIGMANIASLPDNTIYQFFLSSLGKQAAFSLIAIDKGFYDTQRAALDTTNLRHEVTQQREPPDYFMKLYFYGPFYKKSPSNKPYVSYDNYYIKACTDIMEQGGRIVYSKCVNDEITDEVYGTVRFANEAREEIIVKNSIVKLANEISTGIRFKQISIDVAENTKEYVKLNDLSNVLSPSENLIVFHKIGPIDGISGDISVPTWELSVSEKDGNVATAGKVLPFSSGMDDPTVKDKVLKSIVDTNGTNSRKILKLCEGVSDPVTGTSFDGDFKKVARYLIEANISYPIYAQLKDVDSDISKLYNGVYGFKRPILFKDAKTDYCIMPVCKIAKISEDNGTAKYTIAAGVKVYQESNVVAKKAFQSDSSISCPSEYENECLSAEFDKIVSGLISDSAKKIEIP